MIEEFKADLVTQILAATGAGDDCEGIRSARAGDVVPATKDQPGVTVDFSGDLSPVDAGGRVDLSPEFFVVLYVSNLKGHQEAAAQANNLILRCAGTGAYRGFHRFLSRFKRWTDSAGTTWLVTLDPDTDRGSVKDENSKFTSFAVAFRLKLTTMLNRNQY